MSSSPAPAGVDENNGSNVPFISASWRGGDTVEVKDGAVWVNGRSSRAVRLRGQSDPLTSQSSGRFRRHLFVMGITARIGDSRLFGQSRSTVIGLAAVLGRALGFVQSATYDNVRPRRFDAPRASVHR